MAYDKGQKVCNKKPKNQGGYRHSDFEIARIMWNVNMAKRKKDTRISPAVSTFDTTAGLVVATA